MKWKGIEFSGWKRKFAFIPHPPAHCGNRVWLECRYKAIGYKSDKKIRSIVGHAVRIK